MNLNVIFDHLVTELLWEFEGNLQTFMSSRKCEINFRETIFSWHVEKRETYVGYCDVDKFNENGK